jgi:magnesium transporter
MMEPRVPELLVLEWHRDEGISHYRRYTVRGLYRHVWEALADRTGVVRATADPGRRATVSDLLLKDDAIQQQWRRAPLRNAAEPDWERLGGYLHPRDMRRLVTPFSTSNEPELIVRRHVMLLNYDPLRAIILRDRLLVLVPDGADSLLTTLEQRVRGGREAMENSVFGAAAPDHADPEEDDDDLRKESPGSSSSTPEGTNKSTVPTQPPRGSDIRDMNHDHQTTATDANGDDAHDEWQEMATREWVNLPFELQCVDAVLHVVGAILSKETFEVQLAAEAFIERILLGGHGLEDDPLTIIGALKDAVKLMSSRVKSFVQSLHRLLDDEEDMALMNLSRLWTHPERFVQSVSQRILSEESDEPELILEAHLHMALTLTNHLDLIQGKIRTAKELMDQQLDVRRNKLLLAEMLISVFILCITLATLVGAFFGMNVEIPPSIHTYPKGFEFVVLYSCLGGLILFVLIIMILFMYTGAIPVRLHYRFRPVRIRV